MSKSRNFFGQPIYGQLIKYTFKPRFSIIKYKYVKEFHFCVTFPAKKFVSSMIIRIFAASVLAKPLNNAQIVRGVFCLYTQLIPSITIGFRILMENTTSMKNTTEPSL